MTFTLAEEQVEPAASATVREFDTVQDAVFSTELDSDGNWNDPSQIEKPSNPDLFA